MHLDKTDREFDPDIYRRRWTKRIKDNRRKYFFENEISGRKFHQLFKHIIHDIRHFIKFNKHILAHIHLYGAVIKKRYDVSRMHQWYRMFYITFILKVNPVNFRSRRLFVEKNWELADQFDYGNFRTQVQLAKKIEPEEHGIITDKYLFYEYCKSRKIDAPGIIAIFENGEIFYPESKKIKLPEKNLFMKERSGGKGINAEKILYSNGDYYSGNQKFNSQDLIHYLLIKSKSSDSFIIQKELKNHSLWKEFTAGGLASCRIVTGRDPETKSVIPLYANLKMPVKNQITDNYFSGALMCNIEIENGKLGTAYCLNPLYETLEFNMHPDTGIVIKDTILPKWDDVLGFTIQVHSCFRSIFVGWDVSFTEDGITVLEGNIEWSATAYEATNLLPFNRTMYPVLYEKWLEKVT